MSDTLSSNVIGNVVVTNLVGPPCFSIDQQSDNLDQISLHLLHLGVVEGQSGVRTTGVKALVAMGLLWQMGGRLMGGH